RFSRDWSSDVCSSDLHNEISGNWVAYNDVGVKLWAGSLRNQVTSNAFVANRTQVFYVSSADLELGKAGPGNYWSDYTGWDQNNRSEERRGGRGGRGGW